jgi:MurNAc alpha-1-phosphate uridylyltransferase
MQKQRFSAASSPVESVPSPSMATSLAAPSTGPQVPAMLLAAGRGERMRPLTDTTPKPLLKVRGLPLLQWHLQALQQAGVSRAVINTAWLGEQIEHCFSSHFGTMSASDMSGMLSISYSHEQQDFGHALETAGGIARALPQLGAVFWLAAGDVFAPDFIFDGAVAQAFGASERLAHLWLVPNPEHNPGGDFGLSPEGLALNLAKDDPRPRYTYSTIALLRAELFAPPWCAGIAAGNPQGVAAPLAPLLRAAMDQGRVSASVYAGRWTDVGTPQRLQALQTE